MLIGHLAELDDPLVHRGSPPLTVNQYGARPSDRSTFSHSSSVSSFSRFIQMLHVRHRELHRGEGERVRFIGSILGQPSRRYSWNSGMRARTAGIEFIGLYSIFGGKDADVMGEATLSQPMRVVSK